MAEVSYVLEGLYGVPRYAVISSFRKLINDVYIVNSDVLFRALEIYDDKPKLDFVDCLMYGYKKARNYEIISFDKKLNGKLNEI